MKENRLKWFTFLLIFLLFYACVDKEIDSSQYNWIEEKGYSPENIERIRVRGKIPAPEVEVKIGQKKYWAALDVSQENLIFKDSKFSLEEYSPIRMLSWMQGTNDYLFEVGNIKNVKILGENYNETICYLLKRSSQDMPFKGYLGRKYFNEKQLTIDFDNSILAYKSSNESFKKQEDAYKIDFYSDQATDEKTRLYFKGQIDTIDVLMTINTCRRATHITPSLAKRIDEQISREDNLVTIKNLKIGGLEKKDAKAQIDDELVYLSPEGEEVLGASIGLNILKEYLFSFNLAKEYFLLEKYRYTSEKDSTDE